MLQSPFSESLLEHEISSAEADELELEEQFELLSTMDLSAVAATGSSEAALGLEIIGHPDAHPTTIGSSEVIPSTPLSTERMREPSTWTRVRMSLAEPESTKDVENIRLHKDDDAEARRWAKLAHTGFDLRCAAGQRFSRDPDANNEAYRSSNTAKKAVFRKQWAKKIYESICKVTKKVMVKPKKWSNIDFSKGTYMPFACIVREEGNDDAGMTVAINYVQACQEMAGVWKRKNLRTKRGEFLYMRQEVREIFEQSWKVFEKDMLVAGHEKPYFHAPGNGARAVTGSTEAAVDTAGKQKGNASKLKATGAVTGSTEAVAGKDKAGPLNFDYWDTKTNPLQVALKDAVDTRTMYRWVTSQIELVINQINTNKDWKWARGYYQQEIMRISDPIYELTTTGFARLFLTHELEDISQKFGKNYLLIHTQQFSKEFDFVLRKANNEVNKLNTMQSM
jgi:hypothetical protein